VANFAVTADGLTVTCESRATGESGWWDFGDGTPLEPFDPGQPTQTHTYAKPGCYAVKLTVRNFLAEVNERPSPRTAKACR
jgi:PKD repeat protein